MSKENIELNLPDTTGELIKLNNFINKIYDEIHITKEENIMSDGLYESIYDSITRGLFFIGDLSLPFFEVNEDLEQWYFKQYKHAPELAKTLWLKHYGEIHRPFNLVKNKLYRMYDELYDLYFQINKCPPPNVNG